MSRLTKTIKGYKCPTCQKHSAANSPDAIKNTTPAVFIAGEFEDPHYRWVEHIECEGCDTNYKIINAT